MLCTLNGLACGVGCGWDDFSGGEILAQSGKQPGIACCRGHHARQAEAVRLLGDACMRREQRRVFEQSVPSVVK